MFAFQINMHPLLELEANMLIIMKKMNRHSIWSTPPGFRSHHIKEDVSEETNGMFTILYLVLRVSDCSVQLLPSKI